MLKKVLFLAVLAMVVSLSVLAVGCKQTQVTNFKATFEGPGGHSNGAYGNVNAIHAASRALMALEAAKPGTYSVKDFKGGNSVNSIAATAGFTISAKVEQSKVESFKKALEAAIMKGVSDENAFRGKKDGEKNPQGLRMDVRGAVAQVK